MEIISEIAVLGATMKTVLNDIQDIKKKLDSTYVSKETFDLKERALLNRVERMEKIIYAVVSAVSLAVLGAILKVVLV